MFEEVSGGLDQHRPGRAGQMPSRAYLAGFAFKGAGPAEAGEGPVGRRAQPRAPGEDAQERRQPAAARRADQRPGRGDAALAWRRRCSNFAGCAVVISHDRWFLDRIATHILAFEGDSKVFFFEGNFQDYEADKKKRLGRRGAAAAPHQVQAARPRVIPGRGGPHHTRVSESHRRFEGLLGRRHRTRPLPPLPRCTFASRFPRPLDSSSAIASRFALSRPSRPPLV